MVKSGEESLGKHIELGEKFNSQSSDSNRGPPCGSEGWFRDVIGLPKLGIDPLKDINHVSDNDLIEIFGNKVANRGYSYLNCKSKEIKKRIK